jgi:hypothetical protein
MLTDAVVAFQDRQQVGLTYTCGGEKGTPVQAQPSGGIWDLALRIAGNLTRVVGDHVEILGIAGDTTVQVMTNLDPTGVGKNDLRTHLPGAA